MPLPSSKLKPPTSVPNPLKKTKDENATDSILNHVSTPTLLKRKVEELETSRSKIVRRSASASTTVVKPSRPPAKRTMAAVTSAQTGKPPVKPGFVAKVKPEDSTFKSTADSAVVKKKRAAWDTKGRLQDMEDLAGQLKDKVHSSEQHVSQIQTQLQSSEVRVGELESFRRSLEESLETKKKENSEKQDTIDELERQVRKLKEELEDSVRSLNIKHEAERSDLEAKVKLLKSQVSETSAELDAATLENKSLKSVIASQSSNLLAAETQLRSCKLQLETLESTLVMRDKTIAEMELQMKEANESIKEMETKIRAEEVVRRMLHNTIQELKGNIRVFCRVRPPLDSELAGLTQDEQLKHISFPEDEEQQALILHQVVENATGAKRSKEYEFKFDRVFGPSATQAEVFQEISQLVQSACDGYNVCIFAYGQTSSGKTFTMEGPPSAFENPENVGMIPRAVMQVWDQAEALKEKGWSYEMEGSYIEIYNESIRDLLGDGDLNKKHDIQHNQQLQRTIVSDLQVTRLHSPDEVMQLLKTAARNRKVAETKCNERSSRSHSVFMLRITGRNSITEERCEGVLNLIDLAGSERLSQSGSTGDRLKETQAINKSLSALGDVISALGNKDDHIPYRNSKLTYLLQNSLGGNSKTLMFLNICPLYGSLQESLCSLRFATKVNNCQIGTAKRSVK